MANNRQSRAKKRLAKVKVPTVKVPSVPSARKPAKKKPVKRPKRAKAKAQVKAQAEQHGAPPNDMLPPAMEDTRPRPTQPTQEPVPVDTVATVAAVEAPAGANGSAAAAEPSPASRDGANGPMVQGEHCTWVGTMSEAIDGENSIPVCPHCRQSLLTAPNRDIMELGYEQYELGGYTSINPAPRRHPGYCGLVHWMMGQNRCWPTIEAAADAYYTMTGKRVDPSR